MRTTLDIANDVLHAAKERARREHKTIGEVVSDLARAALNARVSPSAQQARTPAPVYGIRPFPKRGNIVTNEAIDKLREDDAY